MVIVPLHKRPAFAWAALTCLARAADEDVAFHLSLDFGHDGLVLELSERFATHMGEHRVHIVTRANTYRGNSYNLLTAYGEVADCGAERIHMVEEDILVADDYFDFHRQAHQVDPEAFAVSACRNQQFPIAGDPPAHEDTIYGFHWYQSLGVSFRPEKLKEVLPHAQRNYFLNPVGYCKMFFPNSQVHPSHAEQDGLIHRVIEQVGGHTTYPFVPRAYHAGFIGYHRKGAEIGGTPEQQARKILSMTAAELNAHANDYKDHATIDLHAKRAPITKMAVYPPV